MKSEFQIVLETEIERIEKEVESMLKTVNATRDFSAGMDYHALLNSKRTVLVSLKEVLAFYEKGKKKD